MNRKIRIVLIMLGIALLTCGVAIAQDVKYNSMPGTDFSKYHTYKWVPIEGASHPNQIVDAEIKQAVDAQLSTKGMTKTDDEKADLYVGYQIAVDQEKQQRSRPEKSKTLLRNRSPTRELPEDPARTSEKQGQQGSKRKRT